MPDIHTAPKVEKGSVQRALVWMRSQIQHDVWNMGDRLPALDVLALKAGVARYTMWKAVRILADEKIVRTHRGSGIILGNADKNGLEHSDGWQSLAHQISKFIYDGDILPGTALPPLSKLQLQFTACYRTMRKALLALVQRGILLHKGTRFIVPQIQARGSTFEVVFFGEKMTEKNELQRAVVQLSEQQARKTGVHLLRYEHNFSEPFNNTDLQRILAQDTLVGCVVDFWGIGTANRSRNFFALLTVLHAVHKPVAIIDHVGALHLPEPFQSSSYIRVYTSAARIAGAEIGRYLLGSGHRHAAFLTLLPDALWSRHRYEGLKQAFRSTGITDCGVALYSTSIFPDIIPLVCAASRVTRKDMAVLFPGITRTDLEDQMEIISQTIPRLRLIKAQTEPIRRQVKILMNLFRIGGEQEHAESIRDHLFNLLGGHLRGQMLIPLFKKVLSVPAITAWVAATDGTGFAAQDFLRKQSVSMRDRISVCAFDNSVQAVAENLTSYDFDAAGLLFQALSFAVGRPGSVPKSQRVVEWPGILYQRQSSGKAGK
jgi:DNA-binding GntR family transcriptional regulator